MGVTNREAEFHNLAGETAQVTGSIPLHHPLDLIGGVDEMAIG